MKEKFKSTTGITLVALVITIIILLILATVTIRIVLSEGIIKRAENAVNIYNDTQTNELAKLDKVEEKMGEFGEKSKIKDDLIPTKKELEEILKLRADGSLNGFGDAYCVASDEHDEIYVGLFIADNECTMLILGRKSDKFYTSYIFGDALKTIVGEETYTQWIEQGLVVNNWGILGGPSEYFSDSLYEGPSPFSLSSFPEENISSKSYLQRIINSFNK